MANNIVIGRLQQRNDTAANWTSINPTLLAGELGIENNTGKYKIGDGITAWNSLSYNMEIYPFIRFDINQSGILTDAQKIQVRTNIDAQKTLSSTNLLPVTGGGTGATTAADARANLGLTLDSTPVSGSANPVKSGGVFSALGQKQNTLTFDSTPVSGSGNPVSSGGVFNAMLAKAQVLYSNDTAANARALLLAKVSRVTDKPDGCYLIYGGWSGNCYGVTLLEKADSGNAYVVIFFAGDKAYQAYIYNSSGTLTIGTATQFNVTAI